MDTYLDYLKERIEKARDFKARESAHAEYQRALAFARRNNLTTK